MPAIVRAVDYWGAGWKPVAIVHDRQNTLPKERIAQLIAMALHDRDDTELTGLLRPYLDSFSNWGDDPSRSRLIPSPGAASGTPS
jgi:hypothetical protein